MSNLELKGLKLLRALENPSEGPVAELEGPVLQLPLESLSPGKYQPRQQFDAAILEELANSIRQQGIIQPLLVRKTSAQAYEIIAGERRWRAAKLAGLAYVPVIKKNIDDRSALAFALVENIQRQDLDPIEEAMALQRFQAEFHLKHAEIAQMIGRSRASVTNSLRLLRLGPRIREMLHQGQLDMGHARTLLNLKAPEQYQVACQIIKDKLSVRETERLARQFKPSGKAKGLKASEEHPICGGLSARLTEALSTKVLVKLNGHGKGKMLIEINSLKELERLSQCLL